MVAFPRYLAIPGGSYHQQRRRSILNSVRVSAESSGGLQSAYSAPYPPNPTPRCQERPYDSSRCAYCMYMTSTMSSTRKGYYVLVPRFGSSLTSRIESSRALPSAVCRAPSTVISHKHPSATRFAWRCTRYSSPKFHSSCSLGLLTQEHCAHRPKTPPTFFRLKH